MTQETQILNYLKDGNSITQIDALNKFGCFRLAARIYELRMKGHDIQTKHIAKGKKVYASYKLVLS